MKRAALVLFFFAAALGFGADNKTAPKRPEHPVEPTRVYMYPRPADSWLDAQIALARRSLSCGPIDGVPGPQTEAALRAFQEREGLRLNGQLDKPTRAKLILETPPLSTVTVAAEDIAILQPLNKTWLGKSQQTALAYESVLEMMSERSHAKPELLKLLNPTVNWTSMPAGTVLNVPDIRRGEELGAAARLHIFLADRVLQVRDAAGRIVFHSPVSIAKAAEKRPEGELHVQVVIALPDYTFDPEVYSESAEARELGRKLVLPPGPNNPVGLAWIGLDKPGYGIHGTPTPEHVGRTGSHGCFRLANWDALTLLELAYVGMPVTVYP